MSVLTHDNKQYILTKSDTWVHGYDVLVSKDNVFVPAGFQVIGAPEDKYVSVDTDHTDMPISLAMILVRLAYPEYRPQWWDQLTNGHGLVLRYDFKMYDADDTEVSSND